jgi:RimJ/RimL family protein N-acetyltransferase
MGLAREATTHFIEALFENTLIHKLVAYCAAENVDSFRLMEKLGMTREGALREQMLLDGVWTDQLIYGLTKREWSKVRKTLYKSNGI